MHTFIVCRYVAFVLFILINVIIATVAAWNLGTAQDLGAAAFQIDAFLIANAILGTLLIFPIMFVELVRKGAFTSRVWFEVAWVSLFWLLNLSGAAAVTAIEPSKACSFYVLSSPWAAVCTSSHVLLGFTWLNTMTLMLYLLALLICSILHLSETKRIWTAGVRDVDWFASSPQKMKSAPTTPVLPVFHQHGTLPPVTVVANIIYTMPMQASKAPAIAGAGQVASQASSLMAFYPPNVQPLVQAAAPSVAAQECRPTTQSTSPTAGPGETPSSVRQPSRADHRSGLKPLRMQSSSTPPAARLATKPRPPPLDLSGLTSFQTKAGRPDRARR